MIVTFFLVALQSFRNRIVHKLRRLRDPRYLVGAIAGAAYFYFVFVQRSGRHSMNTAESVARAGFGDLRIDVISLIVFCLAILAWAIPSDSGGLEFSQAEIAFLFPAPLRRRDLILYKFIRTQPRILSTSLIVAFFAMRQTQFFGVWAAFTVASLYTLLTALGRARLRVAGVNFIIRLVVVLLLIGGVAWLGVHEVHLVVPPGTLQRGNGSVMRAVHTIFQQPLPTVLLFVPRLFVSAMYPASSFILMRSVAALVALGFLFFFIAARLNVSFEEASIIVSKAKIDRMQRMSGAHRGRHVMFRRVRAPFLAPTGLPDFAIVWKNIIALLRVSAGWAIALGGAFLLLIGQALWSRQPLAYELSGTILAMLAGIFPLMGPGLFANDLRLDLPRFEVLKSYPITGERLIAAEIAAPLMAISFFEILFISGAAVMLTLGASEVSTQLNAFVTAQYVIVALLVAVPVCAVQLVLRNAVPIYFPAWAGRSKEDPRGIAVAGQRFLMLFANLIALSIVLIPAAIVLIPSIWAAVSWFKGSPISVAVATMPAIATIVVEVWIAIHLMGQRFEALDVSNEMEIVEFA